MREHEETVWVFQTKNFRVEYAVAPDYDLDLSWDEDGSTREGLERGDLYAFVAHVKIVHLPTGAILGEDYLGSCIYKNAQEFMDHRQCGAENRRLRATGSDSRCGSYFTDMISEACAAARTEVAKMKNIHLRIA